jgi:transposase
MTQERLTVRKIREVLRLKYESGLSNRAISGACHISNSTVGEYLRRAKAAGLGWPLAELSEEELYAKLFPVSAPGPENSRPLPDWGAVRQELRQKGVTLRLVWIEYIEQQPDGYQYSQYCEYYRRWKKAQILPSMHQEHLGGERMQVDYAGVKIPYTDPATGELCEAAVFVAVLPASNYTYAEAQVRQDQCNWNNGHVRALDFFGGVVRIVVPDNLKTGVHKPNYYEPDINLAYQALAEHYQFAVLPARVRKPKDKAKVENGVQNVERWVIAPLRKRAFFDLYEINVALKEQLTVLNNKAMQSVGRSRRQEFEEIDRPNLRPLPEKPYEYAERKMARVNIDYHIEFDKHLYSVPHPLIHQEVDIRATEHLVEVFYQGKSVARHPRNFRPGRFSTLREHMPTNHQFVGQVNAGQLTEWAANIGPQTAILVAATLKSRPCPEQAYRTCLGILSLAKKHPQPLMEQASQSVWEAKNFSYSALKDELNWLEEQPARPESDRQPVHENIRGHHYYQ